MMIAPCKVFLDDEGWLESALARDGLTKHPEVANQAPSGISEGRWLILLEEIMANPSKAIADDWGRDQVLEATHDAPKDDHQQTQADKPCANDMQAAADHILVLRNIKRIKLLKARKAGRARAHVGVWSIGRGGGCVFVGHALHVWSPARKRKGQFGYLGKNIWGGAKPAAAPRVPHTPAQPQPGRGIRGRGFRPVHWSRPA